MDEHQMKNINNSETPKESFYDLWEKIKDTQLSKDEESSIQELEKRISVDETQEGEYNFKIVLAGDGAVGKTSLRRSYLGEGFESSYQQTIGADFAVYEEAVGSYKVKNVIWDLAGQLKFHEVRSSFYKGAHGALIVCDVTNSISFDNLRHWINELWKSNDRGPVPFVIVGNKSDLVHSGIQHVPVNRFLRVASIINYETLSNYGFGTKSVITSAKSGEGVIQAFKQLAIQIIAYQRLRIRLINDSKSK